jgi:hypothetical protein
MRRKQVVQASENKRLKGLFKGGDEEVWKEASEGLCSGKSGEVILSAGEGVSTDGMAVKGGEEA